MKTALKLMGALIALVLVIGLAAGGWYIYKKQPVRSGSVELTGLAAPVSVQYDERGVPHIRAENEADMYKAQVGAESAKADAVGALARAYGSKVGAQAEKARVAVAKFQALISAKALEWDGWKAKLAASTAKMDAATRQASIIVDGYKLGAMAAEAQAGSLMRRWEADIKQYDAGKELTFRVAQSNATAVTHANDARMEAAKVQLATAMQKVASSWAAVSASAQISGSVQQNISGQQ